MTMSNKTYDLLKRIITIVIPAFLTLFNLLAEVWEWNIPVKAIDATVAGFATFIGVCIGISSANYNKAQENEDGWSDET